MTDIDAVGDTADEQDAAAADAQAPAGFDGVRRVLFVHAHPDDETISTGGTLAWLAARKVKAAVVTATRGERGEVVDGPLKPFEGTPQLAKLRSRELSRALDALGIVRHRFLRQRGARGTTDGPRRYRDSGMVWGKDGRAEAADDAGPDAFARYNFAWQVSDLLVVARRFKPELIVSYDADGGYGHPDHIQCRRISEAVAANLGIRLVEIVTDESTGLDDVGELVEVEIDLEVKRKALAAYQSQLTLTEDGYVLSGGQEHRLEAVERFRFL